MELGARVLPALDGLAARHRGQAICLVAHGGVNRVILSDAMGLPIENFFRIEQDYGCLNLIDCFEDGKVVMRTCKLGALAEAADLLRDHVGRSLETAE